MSNDPNLEVELENDIVELGGTVKGSIRRWPTDGDDNSKKFGKVEAVRVAVSWRTEGRGDQARGTAGEIEIPAAAYGQASGQFEIPIPPNAPISYDGIVIRVIWEVEARTDLNLAIDPKNSIPLLVVPRNGAGRYQRAHPLPKAGYTPGARLGDPNESNFGISPPTQPPSTQPPPTQPPPPRPPFAQPVDGMSDQPEDSQSDETGLFSERPDYLDDYSDSHSDRRSDDD